MWNRRDFKAKAKIAVKANYWKCVLVSFIMALLTGTGLSPLFAGAESSLAWKTDAPADASAAIANARNAITSLANQDKSTWLAIIMILVGIFSIAFIFAAAIDIFLINPFKLGNAAFFTVNAQEKAAICEITKGFSKGYLRRVGTLFLKDLFISLGYLVFFIPGIIVSYCFKMVPYISAERPELTPMEVLKESCRLMKGNKFDYFVLELSFIFWELLSVITLGIVGILWVAPYEDQTYAQAYVSLTGRNADSQAGQNEEVYEENV